VTSVPSNTWVGVDFGTTNSAVAFVESTGAPRLAQFPTAHGPRPTFPSVLYFEPRKPSVAGAEAIERYLASETKGRFIQSLKAYLSDRTFEGTGIGAQHYTLEKLIALIGKARGRSAGLCVVAVSAADRARRPVHFSNPPDAELARLRHRPPADVDPGSPASRRSSSSTNRSRPPTPTKRDCSRTSGS
jgi:hypothetical protein